MNKKAQKKHLQRTKRKTYKSLSDLPDHNLWIEVKKTITPLEEHVESTPIIQALQDSAHDDTAHLSPHIAIDKQSKALNRAKAKFQDLDRLSRTGIGSKSTSHNHIPHGFSQGALPPSREKSLHPEHFLQPKLKRKLTRGKTPISATLDLHGMTQDRAHFALIDFIAQAYHNNIRHVIVITGKGKNSSGDAPFATKGQGVLRKQLPHWLKEKHIKPMIVGFEPTAVHHGGEGAFYVHIRRKR